MEKLYTWKEKNGDEWSCSTFNTIEECIEDAKYYKINEIEIGALNPFKPYIDADDILEKIEDEAYYDYDCSFEFERNESVEDLSKKLTEVLEQWLKENAIKIYFGEIEKIETINIQQ